MHTPVLIAARNRAQGSPDDSSKSQEFGDPINFEMYNFGHLMTAACRHYEVTGERSLLDVAIKATDFLDREFSRPDNQLARHAICPSHYMGVLDLYRTTGDAKYLELARRFLQMRDLVSGGDDNQDRVPFREQREAVGHAVRANYLYAGATDLLLETNDQTLLPTLESCWKVCKNERSTSLAAVVLCSTVPHQTAQRTNHRSRVFIRHTDAITNCQTRLLTMKHAQPSAMCCGTSACGRPPTK